MSTADVAHHAAENKAGAADVSGSVVRWDRFLPTMAVRVLLVEADDSTRQIITALLRKCSYRVAAVADGLKAWELLKGRPHGVDLILTEVELPLISGYALLTLIMEHDVCKNIPVIMMSTNDSVSTVYKCMLRGAADFLVKPVRKNELRNLWQHVWRKQSSNSGGSGGPGPPDESVAQQKFEATAENDKASNDQSSGFVECVQRNRECIEKGSDAQSSCTKPEVEDDELAADITISGDVNTARNPEDDRMVPESSCREAIDLIGAFDANNGSKIVLEIPPSNDSINRFGIFPQPLDLSLRRSNPSQANDDNRTLNHSTASAFSRYVNRPFHPGNSTSPSTQDKQNGDRDYNPDTYGPEKDIISQPIPFRAENVIKGGYGSLARSVSGSPLPSPGTPNDSISFPQPHSSLVDQRIIDNGCFYVRNNTSGCGNNANGEFNSNVRNEEPSPRSNRSVLREAALTKFRLKRKDRCFEKKVRYESRKKLAEQRPRVKGQFVRQVPNNDPQIGSSSAA